MNNNKMQIFWERLREVFSHTSLKTYIYAIGTIAVIAMILINVTGPGKYGTVKKDGKFYLDLDQVAGEYGLDLNSDTNQSNIDYVNGSDNNLTQDLSRSLLITNMYLEQNGMTDPTARGEVLANIAREYQKQATGKLYTESDLNIIRQEDKSSIQSYYNELNSALNNYIKNTKSLNLIDINKAYGSKTSFTETDIVEMKAAITSNILKLTETNSNFINTLIGIPATSVGATYQLQLINLLVKQNAYLRALAQIETDPAKYLMLNGDTFDTSFKSDLLSINDAFISYFKKYGVNFTK